MRVCIISHTRTVLHQLGDSSSQVRCDSSLEGQLLLHNCSLVLTVYAVAAANPNASAYEVGHSQQRSQQEEIQHQVAGHVKPLGANCLQKTTTISHNSRNQMIRASVILRPCK